MCISNRVPSGPFCADQEKEEEVQRVRLKNIHLANQLKRIEQTLRQKEELAEGLHLIDFEQLKIENQVGPRHTKLLTIHCVNNGSVIPWNTPKSQRQKTFLP